MLTGPLLRVRRVGEEVVPRFLSKAQRVRLLPAADALCAAMSDASGLRRGDVDARLASIESGPSDAKVVAGLRKLLLDRARFELELPFDPAALRERLFPRAAAARRSLAPGEAFDRDALVAQIAAELALDASAVEQTLFADLADNERLVSFRPITGPDLLDRYDVALAQAVLLWATRVVVRLEVRSAATVRPLFRAARFHGLIYRIDADGDGYRIELDGPLSLFSSVQRYGLRLALFLPALLRTEHWSLEADLRWGRSREPACFRLAPRRGLKAPDRGPEGATSTEVRELLDGFRSLGSAWNVEPSDRILTIAGHAACVPDLAFCHRETGEVVYLELFGFWSRAAVWQRIEAVRAGLDARMILCVGKHLRVSEELLDERDASELYVYRVRPSPRTILERLERSNRVKA